MTNPATNTATISVSGGGFTWTDEAISFAAAASNGYFCTAALTATLPVGAAQGATIIINTVTGSNVVIQAGAGAVIVNGSNSSTVAGTATAAATGNSITLVYRASELKWRVIACQGSWSLA